MSYYSRLFPFLKPYLLRMVFAMGLVACIAIINLLLVRMAGTLWDLITVQRDLQAVTNRIGIFLLLVLVQGVLSIGHSYLTALISQHIMADFRRHVFSHLQKLSLNFFSKKRTGELLSRLMNDVGVLQTTMTETPIDSAKQIVTAIGGIGFLLVMNWKLCLLIVVILPILVLVARLFGKKLKTLSTSIQDQTATVTTLLEEVFSGIRVVKSFVQTPREERRLSTEIDKSLALTLRRAAILAVFIPTITLLTFAAAASVMWFGGQQVIEGSVSPGDLFAFVLLAGILIGPFGSAARVFSQIKEAQGAMTRVFEILDTTSEIADKPDAQELPVIEGHVTAQDLGFYYDPRQPVLSHISFSIAPGEIVALVGPTGAGKTTLINLLHRFYDPTSGTLSIDGLDLRDVRLHSLYKQIGLVPQETFLFGGSIRDNIHYGREDATEKEIEQASRAANAHDFIIGLPDGYDTIVGEKGINLSGGQRQRIAIARALLKNPRVLLLDEATSALDAESERLVQEALDRLMQGRTTFIVAHRLTTVQRAHRILVINHGKIVEEGTHESLLQQEGLYHYLYTIRQSGWGAAAAAPPPE